MQFKQLIATSLITAAFAFTSVSVFADPVIDKLAPAFTGNTADGGKLSLDSLRGKTVVLEWTNNECPFVQKHYESSNIPQLQKDAASKDISWVQIISSAPGKQGHVDGATALKLNESRGAKPAYVVLDEDGKIGKLYGAQTTPHIYVIDAKGVLVYKGGIDNIPTAKKEDLAKANNYVKETLVALADGKKVPHPSTKPYGCSIKYPS